jgi:HlyD family secretion protein
MPQPPNPFENYPTMNDTTAATEELRRALAAEEGGRRWLRRLGIAGGIALVVGAGIAWRTTHAPPPPAKYVTKAVETGDISEKVQATGAVQPLLQVNVGAQVNGRVTAVLVDFNSPVKRGDVLAIIDPKILGTQVSAQQAQLLQQKATLEQARAQAETSKAQMETARVTLERVRRLNADSLASKADLDTASGQFDAAKATYDAAMANVQAAQAAIGAQEAQLNQMTTNLGYTKIISPVDGVVVTRSIDPGATVVASFQAPVLFVIAQDLKKMRVMADIDEADVGKLREGMQADAVVDAFPGEQFHGIVQQVRYSPNNVSGVVTYSAVVEVANPDEKLRPGMTATVTIKTSEVKGAAKIPNAALRYKPTPAEGPDGKPVVQAPEPPLAKGTGRVYVLTSDKPGDEKEEARVVPIGITDGIATEVKDGALPVGTKVVTDENDDKNKKKQGF